MANIIEELQEVKKASQAQTKASQNIADEVSGKMGEIDKRIDNAEKEVDAFVAGHMGDIHRRIMVPNILRNSPLALIDSESGIPFWSISGDVTVEEVAQEYFFAWNVPQRLDVITGIYKSELIKSGGANYPVNIRRAHCLKITNNSEVNIATLGQIGSKISRRDVSGEVVSTIMLSVDAGGVGFRRGYSGHPYTYSAYLCVPDFTPIKGFNQYDPLRRLEVEAGGKFMVMDYMVDSHTGTFGLYLQPKTSIVIQAPMCYLSVGMDEVQDKSSVDYYGRIAVSTDTYIDQAGAAHYL